MTLGPLKDASFERKIERALVCLEAMNDFGIKTCDEFYLANSWLELFWWGSSERLLKKSGTTALSYFEQALEKEIVPEDQIYAIRYLSAEINRRLGNIKKAAELFDTVISLTAGSEEFKWLYELATRQKTTPQENM
jgi:tetratricopeptide (TPR) repeat protein